MSFHNRTTGILTANLPAKYAVGGVLQPLRGAYEAGNISLPYAGWYSASITDSTPAPHQVKVDGTWTYDDETGVATMTRTVASKSLAQATAEIKAEAQRRIDIIKGGPEGFRGENAISDYIDLKELQDAGQTTSEQDARITALKDAKREIFRLRAKSNALETQYEVTPFDYTADSAWAAE